MSHLTPAKPSGRAQRQRAIAKNLFTTDELRLMQARIDTAYDEAPGHLHDTDWYAEARQHAVTLANIHGCTVRQAVGVIAALSPSTEWEHNLNLANSLLASGDCAHQYGDAIDKARAIANGADPYTVLGGRKVRSFFRCILYPNRPGPVCIDRHAYSIAQGRATTDAERKVLDRTGVYAQIAAAYRSVARAHNTTPQQVQAVTWAAWREQNVNPNHDVQF